MSSILKDDEFLRKHGFSIYSRPKRGSPIWTREGLVVNEIDAHRVAANEEESLNLDDESSNKKKRK